MPTYRGSHVGNLHALALGPWARFEARGAIVNLAEQLSDDAWVLEVPPAGATRPAHHLFEAMVYVLSGGGSTKVWSPGSTARTFEWGRGSLFAIPLNASYQLFNGSGTVPARLFMVTSAPTMLNLIRDVDFVFDNERAFPDRFDGRDDFFSDAGREIGPRTWKTNFVPHVRSFDLRDYAARGAGGRNVKFSLAGSAMAAHISEFPVGTYKMAHRHGAGAHVLILGGTGFSLLWPDVSDMCHQLPKETRISRDRGRWH